MRKFLVACLAVMSITQSQNAFGQVDFGTALNLLVGEVNFDVRVRGISGISVGGMRIMFKYSEKWLGIAEINGKTTTFIDLYVAPKETKIVSANFKTDNGGIILVLLSNGSVVDITYDAHDKTWVHTPHDSPIFNFASAQKIVGDALYILKSGKVYASRDTAKTWQIDTTNIGSEYVADIAVDTSYYAWAITQGRKLYYQHPDSNVWHRATSFVATGIGYAVFVDIKGRIFVSASGGAFLAQVSTDRGASWVDLASGLNETITSFGDDAYGNVYAVGIGSHAYRLSNLTPPWVSIGDSLSALAHIPSSAKIINSINGDSILYAATIYGMFQSTDFGANWVHSPNQVQTPAHNFYTPVVRARNHFLISTNLGIYRVAVGDTSWEKVFPEQRYVWGINVMTSDSAGNVYGDFPVRVNPTTIVFYTMKSTDEGTTWFADTAGQKALGFNAQSLDYAVDAQGTQYLSGFAILYSKKPGQPWKIDTTGLGMKSGEFIRQVAKNNKKGIVYVSRTKSSKFAIYSRSAGSSVWQIVNSDTLGATDAILQSDHLGNILVKVFTTGKVWRFDGIKWTTTPLPTGLGFTPTADVIAVDKNGVIWATIIGNTSPANKGVYFTTDNGTTWKYAGLLGTAVKFLTADVDTLYGATPQANGPRSIASGTAVVYAVTSIDGVYSFTTASTPTSVGERSPSMAKTFELSQNYPNPFNPSTVISYQLSVSSEVALKIFDVLGREVATLVKERKGPGAYTVEWNAAGVSSGIYFYTLKAGGFVQTRKMLVIK